MIDSSVLTAACTAGAATVFINAEPRDPNDWELALEAPSTIWSFAALVGQIILSFMLDVPVYSF